MTEENEEGQLEKRRVQIIAPAYYSRKDVQEAMYAFCQHREVVPRYLEGFGKRPDAFDYPSDIIALAKKGATSFHCSEELWGNPLDISTDMTPEQYNRIKIGWDFLIDIDSKFFDYAKIAAVEYVKILEHHGVKNIGIKYSGSKGFHLIIPYAAFPEELYGEKTKDKFPEWPRAIVGYIHEITKPYIDEKIQGMTDTQKLKKIGELVETIYCLECETEIIQKEEDLFECENFKCKYKLYFQKSKRREHRCPACKFNMNFVGTVKRYFCEKCKKYKPNSKIQTRKEQTIKSQADSVDLVLVAPRHLFRAPYSLHEKTSLVSVVIDKKDLENFQPTDADPLKIKIKDYMPKCEKDEAKPLLTEALDWAKKKGNVVTKKYEGKGIDVKGLQITEDIFPDVIKKIMQGMKQDGRKRALSVLLSFFSSLELPQDFIEEKVQEWNGKNYKPLRDGYVKSQVDWAMRNKRLPPNYDKPTYKELGVLSETHGLKNPINYTIREAMRRGFSQNKKDEDKNKN